MGYLHIENLYKNQDILLFRECYALEKIHGTSAHVSWKDGKVGFFSGGVKHEAFCSLFDAGKLESAFSAIGHPRVVVFGEAYGGKCQGMKKTYGDALRFVAFDVKVGDSWLSVPQAEDFVKTIGLEFVHYRRVSTDMAVLDAERDAPSVQAVRNGMPDGLPREGIVLRPIMEFTKNNGDRVIAKHKGEKFMETSKPRKVVDPAQMEILVEAEEIANEWVTPMRLAHVLDKHQEITGIEHTGPLIVAMLEDVERESRGEVIMSEAAKKAISKATAFMWKKTARKNKAEKESAITRKDGSYEEYEV